MRILITNVQLNHRTGTEIVVRDLSAGLRRRGHDVAVYTPNPGVVSDEMGADGTTVVTSLDEVPFEPDVMHCHHHTTTVDAVAAFPTTPAVFVCHDRFQFEDIPPRLASITRYVAVDLNCYQRLAYEAKIPVERIAVIHNAVDLQRFPMRPELPPAAGWFRRRALRPQRPRTSLSRPRRGALFSNNTNGAPFTDVVRLACAAVDLPLDIIGEGGTSHADPGQLLSGYDLVFSKARCALEALCSGCAVVLIDLPGMGPIVTRKNVDALRDWNFGMRCLQGQSEVGGLIEHIGRYDPADSRITSVHIRQLADLERSLDRYETIYRSLIDEGTPTVPVGTPVARQGLTDALSYAASLEGLLRSGQPLLVMPPLPTIVADHITIRSHAAPTTLSAGTTAHVPICVTNRSSETLSSEGATPVNLSYRWHVAHSRSTPSPDDGPADEPRRTALAETLHPWASLSQDVTVDVPDGCGDYFLDVTLVQESVMWFDHLDPPVLARLPIRISTTEARSNELRP